MQVLIIASVWPEPASSGAGLRMMELIRLFCAQGWRVTVASTAAANDLMADLDTFGVQRIAIRVNDSRFDRQLKEIKPELVLFDRFTMEEQFGWRVERVCPQALRIIETVELHSLRKARYQQFKRAPGVIAQVTQSDLFNGVALREVAAMHRADLSILVSEFERHLLIEQFAMQPDQLCLCPFMFESSHIADATMPFDQRSDFVTIGNFLHPPNRDAVVWLKTEIWPLIRTRLPGVRMHIYGAYMQHRDAALHDDRSGFLMHGRAGSVADVMQQARIALAPLRFGAGIKTKLADAMLAGTPSVTTSIGAEGMCRSDLPWPGTIADAADQFADAAVALYNDAGQWREMQGNGVAIVQSLFSAERNGAALIERLQLLRSDLEAHRCSHFTGMMLRHHHQRSTEFMSRWIEAKNRLQ